MASLLLLNARTINEGVIKETDILIKDEFIEKIGPGLSGLKADKVIDLEGSFVMPGIIDDQVHFREPGLLHKGDIYHESKAAVAGGITSFMEMPNTIPNTLTQALLEEKYELAAHKSLANYSFYMGASNDNLEEVLKTNPENTCGVKIFMGSSTGNMLVNNSTVLEKLFRQVPMLVAVHCEDEYTIQKNIEVYKTKYGEEILPEYHAEIRSEEACYISSSKAVELAKKFGTRLHVLHISTAKELSLFQNSGSAIPLEKKAITAEVCVHHLWFDRSDYQTQGNLIKWNPSIKEAHHKSALLQGLLDNTLDIVATDHAPHTLEEKQKGYWQAPSGGPLVQHAIHIMLEFCRQGKITLEKIAEKMAHAPAICFNIDRRGFLREGYYADIIAFQLNHRWVVGKENILYKCHWSPLEGKEFFSKVTHTMVSGHLAYQNGIFNESKKGRRLKFKYPTE